MKKIILSYILSLGLLNAAYLNKDVAIIYNKKQIGSAKMLSEVNIIKENKDSYLLSLKAFVSDDYQEEMLKAPNKNEVLANFWDKNENATYKTEKNPYLKIIKEVEDEYAELWYEVSIEFEAKKSDVVNTNETLLKEAKALYEQSCSACHRLHSPDSFTINQWPSNIDSMIGLNYVDLSKEEKAMIIKYLQTNAKDAKGE
ncbi:hypothetical protein [Campylobacter canadensis]|uniref:Uncharacterized protein n=1 Tax=Campylobacter canadensis TaxID=449520 RepID=A0ABS7WQ08_9BACT|nr:hypothetical protein [Campylobacter canadensis]MBZ7986593.1 hypothetical protein [Campylobacter canadensis]MBZ7994002.1 hypothetical protein [Campylobacter canadensis]MBZ7995995.1 hypothetical protein [Campylobacter canadensis]MBZ7997629.1 hypothetical protein [Campylobacter canadensis]MBZ7999333.1 hypothetical protein [Campylobacter canadensis]